MASKTVHELLSFLPFKMEDNCLPFLKCFNNGQALIFRAVYDSFGSEGVAAVDMLGGARYVNRVTLWLLRRGGAFSR